MKLSEAERKWFESNGSEAVRWSQRSQTPDNGLRVETKTDELRVIWNEWSLEKYIEQHGDVEVYWDKIHKYYRVPAFKEQRDRYCAAKAVDCQRWGCE